MNAFQIPERSYFAGDPAFYGQRQQQHRGAPIQMERSAKVGTKKKRKSRAKPKIVIDTTALIEFRKAGASYPQCVERFGFKLWFVKRALIGIAKPPHVPKPPKPKQRASRKEPLGGRYYVMLTKEQRAFVASMGGAVWVRSLIDRAVDAQQSARPSATEAHAVG